MSESMMRGLRRVPGGLLLLTLVCVFVPFLPKMPNAPLDASWAFGMNQSVASGLAFGRDIVFTFGPYASIYTCLYHPATDLLMLLGALYLACAYWCAVMQVVKGAQAPALVLLLCAILASLLYSRDALLFSYPLLVGIHCYRWAETPDRSRRGLLALALLFSPFGLLPLIKGSLLLLCGAVGALALVLFLVRRQPAAGIVAVAGSALSMLLFWMLAGQPVTALPAWFLSMVPIVSGYTTAMSMEGIGWEIPVYLVAAVALVSTVYRAQHPTPSARTYLTLLFAVFLFLAFKGGFVRHDYHAMMAGTSLLLGALFAALLFQSRVIGLMLAISALVCVVIIRNYTDLSVPRIASNAVSPYGQAWAGLRSRMTDGDRLEAEYRRMLSALNVEGGIPRLQGTTDIYSYHQSFLLASGNDWNPRPVLQSYSAYTPSLMAANRAHLLSATAPDNIVFRLETIDGRMPSSEDGYSWPVLLARYRPAAIDDEFLYLRRQAASAMPREEVIARGTYPVMGVVDVPPGEGLVFARIDLEPTFAGKLVGTFYKPSQLAIRLLLEDGTVRTYRLVPGMVQTGLLVSPLVESTGEFAQLYGEPRALAGKRVKSFQISPVSSDWQWAPEFQVEFVRHATGPAVMAGPVGP